MENYDESIIPSHDPRLSFMRQVYLHAADSKDPNTKIGAVLTADDRAIATGFNGFARKVKDYRHRYADRATKHKFVCHAEANAVATAARLGRATLGSTLYTQGIPCHECCKMLIQAGVKKIVIHGRWPNLFHDEKWRESVELSKTMMGEANIELEELADELGVAGTLNGQTIHV